MSRSKRDKIDCKADTLKILVYSKSKLMDEGALGKKIIGASLIKEAIHLKPDLYSTVSIPLPFISSISVEYSRKLADHGVDMGNALKVSSQAELSILINSLVAMIHGLFYDESKYGS